MAHFCCYSELLSWVNICWVKCLQIDRQTDRETRGQTGFQDHSTYPPTSLATRPRGTLSCVHAGQSRKKGHTPEDSAQMNWCYRQEQRPNQQFECSHKHPFYPVSITVELSLCLITAAHCRTVHAAHFSFVMTYIVKASVCSDSFYWKHLLWSHNEYPWK